MGFVAIRPEFAIRAVDTLDQPPSQKASPEVGSLSSLRTTSPDAQCYCETLFDMAKPRSRPSAKAREAAAEAARASTGKSAVAIDSAQKHGLTPEQALNMMHWVRQGLGVATGTIFGALRLTGFSAITTFLATAVLLPNAYFASVLGVDEAEVAQVGSLKSEGIMPAFACFLLSWILMYTTFM